MTCPCSRSIHSKQPEDRSLVLQSYDYNFMRGVASDGALSPLFLYYRIGIQQIWQIYIDESSGFVVTSADAIHK